MSRRKRWLRLSMVFLVVCALIMTALPGAAKADDDRGSKGYSKHERERLAEARARGDKEVTVLIASKPGANGTVASGIARLGGTVRNNDGDVSYIRAIVPIARAEAAAKLTGIQGIDLDEIIPLDDPRPAGAMVPNPQTPPGPTTPRNNPYMPIADTGAAQFTATNRTWDGRGVTVGIVDSGIDLDHPSLKTTSTGVRKIVDWVTYTDPIDDDDPTWVDMGQRLTVQADRTATYQGQTLTIPFYQSKAQVPYRIGVFNERDPRLGGEVGNDVNRDGNPNGSSGKFFVLWDGGDNVWVDTNQNNVFDEKAMQNYKNRFDIGTFGTDNPATPLREAMPFVVQIDPTFYAVNIGIVSGEHGTHVAGIVAANKMFGGEMSGAAPGAKLISVRACLFVDGCTAHALIEGMIFVAKQRVDVINMSIGGLPSLNDGNNARAILYNRLIDQYNVQMFISAGNEGPGVNTIGDPSVASKVVSVGSYITDETWRKNYGSDSAFVDNLHNFSSRGPREDGGFKPNIVAPGAAVSTIPTWEPGGPVAGTYALPPGYAMLNGTSMASPQAAGAAALLVSAAKNGQDLPKGPIMVRPDQLRQAIYSSARLLDTSRIQVVEQGNGLINVGNAWNLLKQNLKPVTITSSVAVNTPLSAFLATPGVGEGIYDRASLAVGTSYMRQYTFTRTSGVAGNKTYQLTWVGNDGTFSSASSIILPLNSPVTLNVTVLPATAGVHSAILNLDDASTVGIDYQTMNAVIVAEHFIAPAFSLTKSGTVGRNQHLRYFFDVPAGVPAFKVDLAGGGGTPGTGQIRFLRFHPYGVGIENNSSLSCYTPPSGTCAGDPNSRIIANPQSGIWEVTVEARRTSDVADAPFTLTASILGASVAPNPDIIAAATLGVPLARSYTLTNLFGAFTGHAVGTTLGSARVGPYTIADQAQQQYVVNVTAGSTSLRATIGGTSDPGADLDLYIYNCTSGSCVLAGSSADGDSEESVTIANPASGVWVVLIDGYAVPNGTTTYNYVDIFTNPAFGAVSVTDADAMHPAGSSWVVPGTVTANAAPAAGRVLLGTVEVRTNVGTLVGSGDVIIQTVTP